MNNLKLVEETWSQNTVREGKLLTCIKVCGEKMQNRTGYANE